MLEKFDGYFAHSDANVLKAISNACKRLLQSNKAASFIGNVTSINSSGKLTIFLDFPAKYPLLKVFKTTPNHDLPMNQVQRKLELSKWFTEEHFQSTHSNWIKNLVIELFTWFDCEYLAEVAAMQVLLFKIVYF